MPGHKIAREDIPQGGAITKFGQVIGYATKPIAAGEHVHTQNCEFGAHDQDYHIGADLAAARAAIPAIAPRTFMGYRRANGQVGTRNYIAVCATVNCSATVIRRAAEQVMASRHPRRLPQRRRRRRLRPRHRLRHGRLRPGLRQPAARALGPRHPPERRRRGLRRPRLRGDAGRADEVAPSAPPAPSASTA